MFAIEVYSAEARRWYLWLDNVKPGDLDTEIARASKLYGTYRVARCAE